MSGIDFGWQPLGNCSDPKAVTVINTGSGPLEIERAEIIGPDAEDYAIVGDSFARVEFWPGCFCTVDLQFCPRGSGTRKAVLVLTGRPGLRPHQIALSGSCSEVAADAVACDPILVQEGLQVAVPISLRASGEAGDVSVSCGRYEVTSRPGKDGCDTIFSQEITFSLPVTLRVMGECGSEEPQQVECTVIATQTVCVEVPVSIGVRVECSDPTCDTGFDE